MLAGVVVFAWSLAVRGPLAAGLDESVWIVSGIALTFGYRSLYRRARSASVPYAWIGLLVLLFSAGGALVWYGSYLVLIRALFGSISHWDSIDTVTSVEFAALASQPFTISVRTWMTCSCLLLSWSSLYFCINAIIDMEAQRERAVRAVKLADQARLSALQSQLHPHFLFNVHNGIATLIRENDREGALSMIDELSEFLRAIVQKLDLQEISVAEELALINQYLRLQQRRFGARLRATVNAECDTMTARVPTLILQPLVENALEHGILTLKNGGSVLVSIRKLGDKLLLSVDDDGVGPTTVNHATGLGLRNCRDRLLALYGNAAHLSTGRGGSGKGFAVMIELPYQGESTKAYAWDRNAVAT